MMVATVSQFSHSAGARAMGHILYLCPDLTSRDLTPVLVSEHGEGRELSGGMLPATSAAASPTSLGWRTRISAHCQVIQSSLPLRCLYCLCRFYAVEFIAPVAWDHTPSCLPRLTIPSQNQHVLTLFSCLGTTVFPNN